MTSKPTLQFIDNGHYKIEKRIGGGSFGEIFKAVSVATNEVYAVKTEPVDAKMPQLFYECKLYKLIGGGAGVPTIKWCGVEGVYNVMVFQMLGPSLENLMQTYGKFSLKSTIMLADQLIQRLELLHNKDYVHRDIKPDNFLMGLNDRKTLLYIIDLGLCKRYRDAHSHEHIPFKEGRGITGTIRYASTNAHQGFECSRRDDLESIGYMLVYFLTGKLPWQGLSIANKDQKYAEIYRLKKTLPLDVLCKGCPAEFQTLLKYVKGMPFATKPDYFYIRRLLRALFLKSGLVLDSMYDWLVPGVQEAKKKKEEDNADGNTNNAIADNNSVHSNDEGGGGNTDKASSSTGPLSKTKSTSTPSSPTTSLPQSFSSSTIPLSPSSSSVTLSKTSSSSSSSAKSAQSVVGSKK